MGLATRHARIAERRRRPWLSRQVRRALLVRAAMEMLRDARDPLQSRQVLRRGRRTGRSSTPYELSRYDSGAAALETSRLRFHTGDAATVGWMTKRGGWAITEAGIEALETYPTPDELFAELNRRYREIDQRRKQAQQNLSDVQQFIATTLRLVEPGTWTAHDDLADLAGTTASGGCGLPGQRKGQAGQRLPGAQRRRQHPGRGDAQCDVPRHRSPASAGRRRRRVRCRWAG